MSKIAFCFPGGKFTRYYTTILPAVLITSALGIQFVGRWLANRISSFYWGSSLKHYVPASLAVIVIAGSVFNAVNAAPHFRLFTNSIGGGESWAGYYFPHDEFYDSSMRDVIAEIARRARTGARASGRGERARAERPLELAGFDCQFTGSASHDTLLSDFADGMRIIGRIIHSLDSR